MTTSTTPTSPTMCRNYAHGIDEIRQKIASSEWWVFIVASRQAIDLVHAVMHRHYADAPDEALRTAFIPIIGHPTAIVMARKLYMLPSELAALARVKVDGQRDLIITPDVPPVVVTWFWRTFK